MADYFCKQQLDEKLTCLVNGCLCGYENAEEAKGKCIPYEPLFGEEDTIKDEHVPGGPSFKVLEGILNDKD